MEELIIYTLKSGLCLGIFLATYTLLLRHTTFFKFNRLFLIVGIVASFVMPLIRYTYDVFVPVMNISMPVAVGDEVVAGSPETTISIWTIAFVVYILGIAALVTRNLISYLKLKKLIRNGEKSESGSCMIIESIDVKSPFSILNYILINPKNMSHIEKDLILKHEATHINQRHWVDLLCSECVLILQWFNPLAWVYIKLLKENHEFLADKAVIDSGISPVVYQAVLINQRFQGQVFPLSNSFGSTQPHGRLEMIRKAKSSSWKRAGALAIVPVFSLFIWASATPNYVMMQESPVTPDNEILKDTIIDARLKGKPVRIIRAGASPAPVADTLNRVNNTGGVTRLTRSSIRYSDGNPLLLVDGVEVDYEEINKIDQNTVHSVTVLKDASATAVYGARGANGVIVVYTKEYAEKNPQLVVTSTEDKKTVGNIKVIGYGTRSKSKKATLDEDLLKDKPLYIIDGKEVSYEEFQNQDVNDIQSFDVLKDKSAIELYGDKGKDGVIIIETKKSQPE